MSATADKRYGRRGGRWAETRDGTDVCDTCKNGVARFHAELDGEQWRVCTGCRDQGQRLGARATYTPLTEVA